MVYRMPSLTVAAISWWRPPYMWSHSLKSKAKLGCGSSYFSSNSWNKAFQHGFQGGGWGRLGEGRG